MRLTLLLIFSFLKLTLVSHAQDCATSTNFFESLGGRSSDQVVKGSDGCKKLVMDDGFEIITLTLASIPDGSADFNIVNYDATPGDGEIAVKYYYYSGNAVETMTFGDSGKTAHVCNSGGNVTVTWAGVNFNGTANGNLTYKTACEMTCKAASNDN
jgi:hypothetical protein